MVFELFRWWYGAGWLQTAGYIKEWPSSVRLSFSMPLLVKTLFAPWRRITSVGGRGIDAKIRASVDNLVSRMVGFVSRLLVLFTAALLVFLAVISAIIATIIWPLIPIAIIFFLFKGVVG
jgi:hypothetical protein